MSPSIGDFVREGTKHGMARPRNEHPTPAELEVLKILWERGPATVREVMETLRSQRRRAYTSVMSLLGVMTDKGLVKRKQQGRAFLYTAGIPRDKTLAGMVGDLWQRGFEGSASALVLHLLQETDPTQEELDKIRDTIEAFQQRQEGD